ncbi:hypothetical protein BJ878DRAFT_479399 [Calycina marina]|uniref:Uncharacterized protein n=1 Tax=Calycina marina TaxID=1763456 RepID=A0A9P7Z4Q5_9HELO|nr:hypothetical protein BJ878DRAFT_479399 [Calycina marina]
MIALMIILVMASSLIPDWYGCFTCPTMTKSTDSCTARNIISIISQPDVKQIENCTTLNAAVIINYKHPGNFTLLSLKALNDNILCWGAQEDRDQSALTSVLFPKLKTIQSDTDVYRMSASVQMSNVSSLRYLLVPSLMTMSDDSSLESALTKVTDLQRGRSNSISFPLLQLWSASGTISELGHIFSSSNYYLNVLSSLSSELNIGIAVGVRIAGIAVIATAILCLRNRDNQEGITSIYMPNTRDDKAKP